MRRILCFMIMFSITLGIFTKTEGLLNITAAPNISGKLPTGVIIKNVTNDKMTPGNYTALDGSTHTKTHGIIDFSSTSFTISDLVGTGFNFTCNTCCDWRYCIRFNNTVNNTITGQNSGTGRSKYVIVDINITGVTTGADLVQHILEVTGSNPGGHEHMMLIASTMGDQLVVSSSTSNDAPVIGSGYLLSGIWYPDTSSGPYRYGDWSYDILNDIGIAITGYDGKDKYVTIPNGILVFNKFTNEYEILPVVTIGDYAFNRTKIISVTIPDTVSTIGRGAFYYCTSLTNVTIPKSVKTIDAIAFFNCTKLTNVTLPSSLESIGKDAFSGCKALRDLYFLSTSPPVIDAPFFWGIGGITGVARAIVPTGSKNTYIVGTGNYWNDLLVIEDDYIGISHPANTDIILTGTRASSSVTTPIKYKDGVFEINLTKETITFAWGFEVKAYSLNGGSKWINVKSGIFHESRFPKLLDKGMTLVVSDKAIDKGKTKPGEEAITVAFPPIAKRQSQSPPKAYPDQMNLKKFCVQPIISKNSPSTDPTWFLSLSKDDSTPINVSKSESMIYQNFFIKNINRTVQIGVAANNTVDSRGYGQIPSEVITNQMKSMPRQSLQGQPPKKTYVKYWEYVIRFAPGFIDINGENIAVAASKPRKIKVQSIP